MIEQQSAKFLRKKQLTKYVSNLNIYRIEVVIQQCTPQNYVMRLYTVMQAGPQILHINYPTILQAKSFSIIKHLALYMRVGPQSLLSES